MSNCERRTANGDNVYSLGSDENALPPGGEPFYAQMSASYLTKIRIVEVMNTLATMGTKRSEVRFWKSARQTRLVSYRNWESSTRQHLNHRLIYLSSKTLS